MHPQKNCAPLGLNYDDILILSDDLYIRPLNETDGAKWCHVRCENYDYLQQFEPTWQMDALTYKGYARFMNDLQKGFMQGTYLYFGIFHQNDDRLIGGIELSQIRGWPRNSALIEYWISQFEAGRGYGSQAVTFLCRWAFKALNLITIEAATMEFNGPSMRVLKKIGFKETGLMPQYIEIDGQFEDHKLWFLSEF